MQRILRRPLYINGELKAWDHKVSGSEPLGSGIVTVAGVTYSLVFLKEQLAQLPLKYYGYGHFLLPLYYKSFMKRKMFSLLTFLNPT